MFARLKNDMPSSDLDPARGVWFAAVVGLGLWALIIFGVIEFLA